jgi:2-polyprenyl-3-methyl-5-hydroxy-6-metoxy-1,4-benzoquinol methylase
LAIPGLYDSNETMFRDFSENREAAVARAAAYFSVLPEIVLANVRNLEEHARDNPRAFAGFHAELSAFRHAETLLRELQQRVGLRLVGARVLDVGCGGGHALRAARQMGAAHAAGLELSESRTAIGNEMLAQYGLPGSITAGSVLDPTTVEGLGREYDAILMFDLLEHVPSIRDVLAVARSLVRAGGILVIRSGNPFNPELLLREPHYGLPGMTILPRATALEYFRACRTGEYEVFEWLHRLDIEDHLRAAGFSVEEVPQERSHPISDFDRIAAQLIDATDYPDERIAAEVRHALRVLRLLRLRAPDAEDFFGTLCFTIVGRAGGVEGSRPSSEPEAGGVERKKGWLAELAARIRRMRDTSGPPRGRSSSRRSRRAE